MLAAQATACASTATRVRPPMSDLSRAVAVLPVATLTGQASAMSAMQASSPRRARLPALAAPRASSPKWEQRRALLARLVATRGRLGSKTATYARRARPPVRARPAAPPALWASTVELVPHHALRARRAPFRVPPERGVAATVWQASSQVMALLRVVLAPRAPTRR